MMLSFVRGSLSFFSFEFKGKTKGAQKYWKNNLLAFKENHKILHYLERIERFYLMIKV